MTIGFLSNISRSKGIFDFVAIAEILSLRYPSLRFIIAGPHTANSGVTLVQDCVEKHSNISYLGPVYRDAKRSFLDEIDLLIFPTYYKNEAEPLVVLEAMSSSVPVISRMMGCIGEILPHDCGHVVGADEDFVAEAVARVEQWLSDPELFRSLAERSREHYLAMTRACESRLENFARLLS